MFSKLNTDDIMSIKTFEKSSGASAVDCVCHGSTMYVAVSARDMKRLGHDSAKLAQVEKEVGRRVRVFKLADSPSDYARNIIGPRANSLSLANNVLTVRVKRKDKPLVIGREGRNIKVAEELLRRRFGVKKIVVA